MDNQNFQCQYCLSRDEPGSKAQRIRKTGKGCEQPQHRPVHLHKELKFYRCPGNFYSVQGVYWVQVHSRFESGMMPYPGGLLEQPNKLMEIFEVIESYKRDKIEEEQKKIQKAQSKGMTRGRSA